MTPLKVLQNKRIVLGVTGGIAAFKAAALCSRLVQAGALVDVVMTEAAQKFIAPPHLSSPDPPAYLYRYLPNPGR